MSDPMQKMADPDDDRPMVPASECEHLFVSEHRPGHLIYWVRQCCICHEVDWGELDREVKKHLGKPVTSGQRRAGTPGPEVLHLDSIERMYADDLFDAVERAGAGAGTDVESGGIVVARIVPVSDGQL